MQLFHAALMKLFISSLSRIYQTELLNVDVEQRNSFAQSIHHKPFASIHIQRRRRHASLINAS